MGQKLYKAIRSDGGTIYKGKGTIPLPDGDTAGEWTEWVDGVEVRFSGYHVSTNMYDWIKGDCRLFEAEGRGDVRIDPDNDSKLSYSSIRLVKELPLPGWFSDMNHFIDSISNLDLMGNFGKVPSGVRLFYSLREAKDAAKGRLYDGSKFGLLWDMLYDARRRGVYNRVEADVAAVCRNIQAGHSERVFRDMCSDAYSVVMMHAVPSDMMSVSLANEVWRRWSVWANGYAVAGYIDGVLCAYKRDLK